MSIDRDFRVGIEADATSAVAATKQVADETQRYNDALVRMALGAKQAESAQRKLEQAQREAAAAAKQAVADQAKGEAERYQAALEKMAQEQALASGKHGRPEDDWFAGVAERRAVMLGALKDQSPAAKSALEEIRGVLDKTTGSTKNLKDAMSRLAIAFPELGMIGRSMLSPITAAALAVGGAFALVKREIASFNDAIQDVEWEGYASGAKKASEEVRQIRDLAQEAAEASERLMDVFRARESAEERRDAASKRYELARAAGEGDPAKRAALELEIEDRYARREFEREERGRKMRLQEQERRAAELLDKGRKLEGMIGELKAIQGKIGDPESLQGELAAATTNLKAERAALVAAETKFEEVDAKFRAYESTPGGFGGRSNPYASQRELLRADVEGRSGTVGSLIRRRGDLGQRLRDAELIQGRLGQLEPAYENVSSSYYGIQGMLPTQRAVAGIESGAARESFDVGLAERGTRARAQASDNVQRLTSALVEAIESNNGKIDQLARELESWKGHQQKLTGAMWAGRNR